MPAQYERDWTILDLHNDTPRLNHFIRIGGPDHNHPRHRAERSEMLNWLMSGTIFTDADRIVRENVKHRELGERGQTDGWTTIVSEHQKCRSGRPENSVIGDTV